MGGEGADLILGDADNTPTGPLARPGADRIMSGGGDDFPAGGSGWYGG